MILGKNELATSYAVDHFVSTYLNNAYTNIPLLPQTLDYMHGGLGDSPYFALAEGADIRVMSFNILTELWNDKLPVEGRDLLVAETILTYQPDVIGLQEVSDKWHARLTPLIEEQYTVVTKTNGSGSTNYSTLAYNHEKVKLVEWDCQLYSKGNSANMRLVTWGLFEQIDSGKRFIVTSTHWDINNSTGPANAYRLIQSGEMAEIVHKLNETYQCPVILTGDYNSSRASEEYRNYATLSGTRDAKVEAVEKINAELHSTHAVGDLPRFGDSAIDHITYTDGATPLRYNLLIDQPILDASDHNPLVVDFALK